FAVAFLIAADLFAGTNLLPFGAAGIAMAAPPVAAALPEVISAELKRISELKSNLKVDGNPGLQAPASHGYPPESVLQPLLSFNLSSGIPHTPSLLAALPTSFAVAFLIAADLFAGTNLLPFGAAGIAMAAPPVAAALPEVISAELKRISELKSN